VPTKVKTKIENIMNKTKIDASTSPVVEEENHLPYLVEETHSVETSSEESHLEESSSIIIIPSDDDDSDIDFVKDRVKNDKASQHLSYFISSKLSNISSNFF
jgi:hypothetical protein